MFDKILVAIDLDQESADPLLAKAKSLAKGEIWAIHVVEPQFVQYSIDPTFTGSLTRAMEEDAIKAARARMNEICTSSGIPSPLQRDVSRQASDGSRCPPARHHRQAELPLEYASWRIVQAAHAKELPLGPQFASPRWSAWDEASSVSLGSRRPGVDH